MQGDSKHAGDAGWPAGKRPRVYPKYDGGPQRQCSGCSAQKGDKAPIHHATHCDYLCLNCNRSQQARQTLNHFRGKRTLMMEILCCVAALLRCQKGRMEDRTPLSSRLAETTVGNCSTRCLAPLINHLPPPGSLKLYTALKERKRGF